MQEVGTEEQERDCGLDLLGVLHPEEEGPSLRAKPCGAQEAAREGGQEAGASSAPRPGDHTEDAWKSPQAEVEVARRPLEVIPSILG